MVGSELAARNADAVPRIETALARASPKRVDRRDPHKLIHKMSPSALQRPTPEFERSATGHVDADGGH